MSPSIPPTPALVARPGPLPPAPATRSLSTPALALVVAALVLGAWRGEPAPAAVALAAIAIGAVVRRPLLLAGGALLVGSVLGHRALDGLRSPPVGPIAGRGTLLSDPQPGPYGTRAEVRLGGRRWSLQADGAAAGALAASLAGELVAVRGRARAPSAREGWMVPRHLVGVVQAAQVERVGGGSAPMRGANRVRRLLGDGASALAPTTASLYAGFVLGDDRSQPAALVDDFRATGLSHVLVVSGQNLAFLLILLRPVLDRVRWSARWGITLAAVAAFATVTRFEPSVLRASAMAAVAVTGQALGRPQASLRVLVLAVGALVLVDPLLVRAVGFQLSVGASLGIVVLGGPVARALPGPRWAVDAVAVTVAAQLGVAPALLPLAGGMPVVALLANPLAVPVAGLVTVWGLPAGLVAGLGGPDVAALVHGPTSVAIAWVAAVARLGARLPLGELHAEHLLALVALGAVASCAAGAPRRLAGAAMVLVLVSPALALARWHPDQAVLAASGARVQRRHGQVVVEVLGHPRDLDLLADLRRSGVVAIDRLVVPPGDPDRVAVLLAHRWPIAEVVAAGPGR